MRLLSRAVHHGLGDLFRVTLGRDGAVEDRLCRLEYGFVLFVVGRIWFGPSHWGSIASAELGLAGYVLLGRYLSHLRRRHGGRPSGS
jgi:hypothetical protein